ncbi:MAG: hypothetical protein C0510_03895 [Erythrobacter sp.]|nr:hypothetical protein [Erythrobacter sp.]
MTICAFSLQVRTRLIALCNLLSGLAIPQQVLPARLRLGDNQFFAMSRQSDLMKIAIGLGAAIEDMQ